jgi:PAS domain S-box-containing protein
LESSNDNELLQGYKEAVDYSSIVTKTDLKGRITYANNNFCKISGYDRDELIGKPHNIVRHPDQSSESFKDMWSTIQSKKPWKGIVKNKHKDGGSYYVFTNVIPFLDKQNEITEYISIRQDITQLHELTNHLEDRVQEEVEKNHKKDQELVDNLNLFLDSTPNPILVLSDDKIEFINKAFLELISKDKNDVIYDECLLRDILVKSKGYVSDPSEFELDKENRVAIETKHGKNIFNLYYKKIRSIDDKLLKMITLNNITISEYQKFKINHYNEQLQEFYLRTKRYSDNKDEELQNKVEQGIDHKTVRELSDEERTLLKRKHDDVAVTSEEYSQELDEHTLLEIQELGEIEEEVQYLLSQLDSKDQEHLNEIVLRLVKFSSVVGNLMEFKELAFSLSSLADLLSKQKVKELDQDRFKKMLLFLENIIIDFSNWRKIVFIEQSANDIHYMDSSLFSSILQLELVFNTDQKNEDEDDFELF